MSYQLIENVEQAQAALRSVGDFLSYQLIQATLAEDAAVYIRTGMETSPKLIVPEPIDRAAMGFLRRPGKRTPPRRVKPVSPYESVRSSRLAEPRHASPRPVHASPRTVHASIVMRHPASSRTTSAT